MMTEGRVRAIAAQVAAAIAAKIKPPVPEEQIRSDVEAVIRQMQENGELTGSDLTDEQIAAVQENAEAAAESAQAAGQSAEEAETSKSQAAAAQEAAEAARRAAEAAESGAAQKATAAEEAAARAEAAADRLLGMAVVGEIETTDGQTSIVLTGDLAPGPYTFAYLVKKADGTTETVTIGTYTVEDEPVTKTYTITWVNYDGTVLEIDEKVPEGETPKYNGATPTKPADDQYTYTFKGWDKTVVAATADATYAATYTQAAKPEEPSYTNLLDGVTIEENKKMSTSSGGTKEQTGARATDFIAIPADRTGEIFRIYNVSMHGEESVNNIIFYDASKTMLGSWKGVAGAFSANVLVNNGVYSLTPNKAYANTRYIRFSCGNIDANSIVTLGEENV